MTAVSIWLVIFAGSAALHVFSGPSLPSGSNGAAQAAAVTPIEARVDEEQTADLANLAEQARKEAEQADAELAELMREEEAAQVAADRALAAEAADAARAAAAARRIDPRAGAALAPRTPAVAPRDAAGTTSSDRRIVRVMPTTATV